MKRVLVRAANWIGDAVMSIPALRRLRESYSHAHISILARPWVSDVYVRERLCDALIPYTPAPGFGDFRAKWRLARQLAKEHFDTGILFTNSFESALIFRLAGIPEIVGYKRDGRTLLLSKAVPVSKGHRHERFFYLELLERSGLIGPATADPTIELKADPQSGIRLFRSRGIAVPVIGLSPGAAFGSAKRWLPERFAESAQELANTLNASVAIFGSSAEHPLCERVAQLVGPAAHNLAGQTSLREFIDMASACRLYLTNDSGSMHIAAALGIPTVAIFGSTDHVRTGPASPLARVIRQPVECSPCLKRECPIDHRCMTGVAASQVTGAALEVIGWEG